MRSTYKPPPDASAVLLVLYLDSSVPRGIVDVDEVRLRQIIVNLISNALKFTDKGSVTVSVSCDWQSDRPRVARSITVGSRGSSEGDEARGQDEVHYLNATTPACCGGMWRSPRCCGGLGGTGGGNCWGPSGRKQGSNVTKDGNHIDSTVEVAGTDHLHEVYGSRTATNGSGSEITTANGGDAHRKIAKLTVSVSDTGIGISPELLEGLFDPFVQGNRTARSHAVGGTGLGLTISKSLVQLMGGNMSCTSEVGKGATFTFTVLVGLVDFNNGDHPSATCGQSPAIPPVPGDAASAIFLRLEGGGEAKVAAGAPGPGREGDYVFLHRAPAWCAWMKGDIRLLSSHRVSARTVLARRPGAVLCCAFARTTSNYF